MIHFEDGRSEYDTDAVFVEPEKIRECLWNIFPDNPEIGELAIRFETTSLTATAIYQVNSGTCILNLNDIRPGIKKYAGRLMNELCEKLIDELKTERLKFNN